MAPTRGCRTCRASRRSWREQEWATDGESSGPLNGTPEADRLEAVKLALDLSGDDVNATADFGGNIAFNEDGEDLLFAYPLNYSADPTLGARPEAALGDVRWAG